MVSDEAFRDVLDKWRKSLIGITKQSTLVKFRTGGRQVLKFDSPEPDDLLTSLRAGTEFVIRGVEPAPEPDEESPSEGGLDCCSGALDRQGRASVLEGAALGEYSECEEPEPPEGCLLLHTTAAAGTVPGILRGLRTKAEELYLERGVRVLYLAFGLLYWEALDGSELCSPLLLVPVTLQARTKYEQPRLLDGDDDEVVNPALKLLLEERGAVFDDLPNPEEATLSEIIEAFKGILKGVNGLDDWRIEDSVHIGKFTFTKEAMYRDLLENEERVVDHPIIRALATTDPTIQTSEFLFEAMESAEVDRLAPEESTPLVLDADSSQRAAIAAARDQKSFVMDGPPGTGKSQTIANMIGTLIHDGKTVLFVSEKVAALDVVRNRLETVGLGSFLFDIHSHTTSRKAVAQELARTLANKPVPPKELDEVSLGSLVEKRKVLNSYAEASNEIRTPLNRSFHDVVGRLAQLTDHPLAPAPQTEVLDLTDKQFAALLDAARYLARSWRPAIEGSAFIWRGVLTDRPLHRELGEALRRLDRVETAAAPHRDLLARLRLIELEQFAELPRVLAHRDAIQDGELLTKWLTADSLEPYRNSLAAMLESVEADNAAVAALAEVSTAKLGDFPQLEMIPPLPRVLLTDEAAAVGRLRGSEIERSATELHARAASLARAGEELRRAARLLGLPEPRTFADAQNLLKLGHLRDRGTFPDQRWFYPGELARVRPIVQEIERQHQYVVQVGAQASQWFTPTALHLPLRDLERRFAVEHTGLGVKFTTAYKADRRALRSALKDPSRFKEGVDHLHAAITWADGEQYMGELVHKRAGVLGRFWNGRSTDYRAVDAAFATVEEALAILPDGVPAQTAAYLSGVGDQTETRRLLESAEGVVNGWRRHEEASSPIFSQNARQDQSIREVAGRAKENAEVVAAAAERCRWVTSTTGRDHTLDEGEKILDAVHRARQARMNVERQLPQFRDQFGPLAPQPEVIGTALDHAERIRDVVGGALEHETVTQLARAGTVADLERAVEGWVAARESLVEFFEVERREELRQEFGTFDDSHDMLHAWKSDQTGQREWSDYKRHRDRLVEFGLEQSVDFCVRQRVMPESIVPIIEQTVLQTWTEEILDSDARLRPINAAEKDAIVEEYRELDRQLVHYTAGQIIRAANSRRPEPSGIGETGLLKQQGLRKKKHLPSRDLVDRARGAVQGLKPVFMMSPLAVSQYLPADIKFDVVIFDEASQVLPADAVNSIYRGRSIILAGDAKQLPPTTFFERSVEEDEETDEEERGTEGVGDYESVLDLAKGSGAFPSLGLKWHYRSQHESLIAYSNYRFYEGKLVTFPSAFEKSDEYGVRFRKVAGRYQKGGNATNPEESRAVARSVVEHFQKRPHLSLGVVTFSVAQKESIEAALLEERRPFPELAQHFEGEDRLGGFFVRSLESVQGDERDVIIFSIGYGPDEAGKLGTSFGVLNRKGGWRRLNVGITRARQAVEVIASMDPDQIPFSTNENVQYLRRYMEFAAKGMSALAVTASPTGLDPESPFEESVLAAIEKWGYVVEPQVGAAGYRIDLGVKHPDLPGKFVLGVECDGYQYHSAPTARDRDRLRDSILNGLGWSMYRIWGTSWYRDREQEEQRLKAAIAAAVSGRADEELPRKEAPIVHPEVVTELVDLGGLPSWVHQYATADSMKLPWGADPADPDTLPLVRQALVALVEDEGPVHITVVHSRLRDWWRLGKIGKRIRVNLESAIASSRINKDGEFLYVGELAVDRVRAPSQETKRSVDQVHPQEFALAVQLLVRDAGFAERDEIIRQVSRIFGWSRTGEQITQALEAAIDTALADGLVFQGEDDQIRPVPQEN